MSYASNTGSTYSRRSIEESVHDPTSFMTQSFMGKSVYQLIDNKKRYTIGYVLIGLFFFFLLLNMVLHTWYLTIAWISTLVVEIGNMIYIYRMNQAENELGNPFSLD
jgi:inner membrane protein involved in colicin E2 resistance